MSNRKPTPRRYGNNYAQTPASSRRASARPQYVSGRGVSRHASGISSQPRVRKNSYRGQHGKNGHEPFTISRRQLLYGAAGVVGIAAIGGGGYALASIDDDTSTELPTLTVPEDAVLTADDFELLENSDDYMTCDLSTDLEYGTMVWASDDEVAACLIPTGEASPLTKVGLMSLSNGTVTEVLPEAVNHDAGYEIYDVRANSQGIIWVETAILDGLWKVYCATCTADSIGTPKLLEEGDDDWEMPSLACSGDYAFWQLLPDSNGAQSSSRSTLKRASFSDATPEIAYSSRAKMATNPYATEQGIVITPRSESSGTYYQLTYIDAETLEVLDQLTLPSSMKPMEAGYVEPGFTFCFEEIYSTGDGISNLGTYVPMTNAKESGDLAVAAWEAEQEESDDSSNEEEAIKDLSQTSNELDPAPLELRSEAYSDSPWFRFARTPSAPSAWCGDWFMVKTPSSLCGVDLANRTYFVLYPDSGSDTYGDYLASTGTVSRIVTFENIDHTDIYGTYTHKCEVKVWTCV
ncbi:MAG: Tat pathway signal protein [Eggerthellaceae bacterium]|nr:Tat pathway signal protein [Eggerthellaceae bacterium]